MSMGLSSQPTHVRHGAGAKPAGLGPEVHGLSVGVGLLASKGRILTDTRLVARGQPSNGGKVTLKTAPRRFPSNKKLSLMPAHDDLTYEAISLTEVSWHRA